MKDRQPESGNRRHNLFSLSPLASHRSAGTRTLDPYAACPRSLLDPLDIHARSVIEKLAISFIHYQ